MARARGSTAGVAFMTNPGPRHRLRRGLRWLTINILVTIALVLMLEGLASFMQAHRLIDPRVARKSKGAVAERLHTEYDPLLGWINLSGITISNMYGAGRHLTINRQRFRGREIPPDAAGPRIVVSGDSFTFGYGVGDDDTWAAWLERQGPGTEAVNMGQGGYGMGQAYLWYMRDGAAIPHDLHIFAFITEDYRRMGRSDFMGYGKPVLRARDGVLRVENVPPPRQRRGEHPLFRFQQAIQNLRLVNLITAAQQKRNADRLLRWREETQETAACLFKELHRLHREQDRLCVLVHLPTQKDYFGDESDDWRRWLRELARREGWVFMDLIGEMRNLPEEDVANMFIASDEGRYRGSKGHYTEFGNKLVGRAIWQRLQAHPAVAARLGHAPRS